MSDTKLKVPAGSTTNTVQTPYGNYSVADDGTVTVDSRSVSALLDAGFTIESGGDLPAGEVTASGMYTATSDDATADEAVIETGLASASMFIARVLRADVDVTGDAVLTTASGDISVADGSTYAVTAGDEIHWLASGSV